MQKKPLAVILGPTAVGKTDTAIETAISLDAEIVTADSMQIYQYMDIGTAKPTKEERQRVPHHMIDIVRPDEEYSVALYQKHAKDAIAGIHNKGKLPILTGGTGLYINSILYPMNFSTAVEDTEYRNSLQKVAEDRGNEYVHSLLAETDPATAERLHPNDIRRVIRALEVYHLTGKTMSEYQQVFDETDIPYDIILIGLNMDREKLYNRINKRVDIMIDMGLVDEVKGLLDSGYSKDLVSMQGLGYKELVNYIEGAMTLDEAKELLKMATRRYAKRQLTWFRRDSKITWLDVDDYDSRDHLSKWISLHIEKNLLLDW